MNDEPAPVAQDPAVADPMSIDPAKTAVQTELKHTSPLISCRFDPTGRFAFAGGQDNSVQRWEVEGGKQTALAGGHDSWVRAIAFHPTGETLYTGGYDGRLIWWPTAAEAPAPTRVVDAHRGWLRALAVSPDGSLVASCGNDNLVKLWSAADGSLVSELAGHECHVYNVAFHPAGQQLVSADLKGVVRQWDVAGGTQSRQLDAAPFHKFDDSFQADIGGVRGMAFSPDGKHLACGGMFNVTNAFAGTGNPLVIVFDWEQGTVARQLKQTEAVNGVIWGVAFHPSGHVIAAAGGTAGGYLYFWKLDAENDLFRMNLPNTARDLDLHADQLRLAIAHHDSQLRIYGLTA